MRRDECRMCALARYESHHGEDRYDWICEACRRNAKGMSAEDFMRLIGVAASCTLIESLKGTHPA